MVLNERTLKLLNIATFLSLFAFIFSALLTCFTGVLTYSTEPSTSLFLKSAPSFQTIYSDTILPTSLIILRDENGFVGDEMYFFTVHYGWYITGAICLTLIVIRRYFRRCVDGA